MSLNRSATCKNIFTSRAFTKCNWEFSLVDSDRSKDAYYRYPKNIFDSEYDLQLKTFMKFRLK